MIRTIALLLMLSPFTAAHADFVAPFNQGDPPSVKKEKSAVAAEDGKKIIEDLKADFEEVVKNLSALDAGPATRRKQQRILDGIDKLLNQEDQNPNGTKGPPSPKSPQPPDPPTKPTGKPAQPKQPKTSKEPKDVPSSPEQPKEKTKTTIGKEVGPATTLADVLKEIPGPGEWRLPLRHRQEIDAFARERFIRNYEELLRAYYRNIAEGDRHKDRE